MSSLDRTGTTLSGAVALISGGLGDIGLAVARELSARGATVALSDLSPEVQARAQLAGAGIGRWRYDRVDVTDEQSVEAWVQDVVRELGPIGIAVPNAGIDMRGSLLSMSGSQWKKVMSVNLDGAWHLSRSAARAMIGAGRGGRIVMMGSIAASLPSAAIPAYCISKAAVRAMTQCLALELAPHRVLVNEVAPGNVDGGLSGKVLEQSPELVAAVKRVTPLHALVPLVDVANAVAWLADPRNTVMTGATVVVDAGWSLLSGAIDGGRDEDH